MPLLVVLGLSFTFHKSLQQMALILALNGGVLTLITINFKYFNNVNTAVNDATIGAWLAIGNTTAVMGFGSVAVAKGMPSFPTAVDMTTSIPGNELIRAAVEVSVIAGLTGLASGGQAIALLLIALLLIALP